VSEIGDNSLEGQH